MWKDGTEECKVRLLVMTGCWTEDRKVGCQDVEDGTEECNGAGCKVIDWVLDPRRQKRSAVKMWKDGTEECKGADRRGRLSRCGRMEQKSVKVQVVKSSTGCWTKRRQNRSAVKMWKDGTEECNGAGCKVID
ncbi:hypothetical protein J6590_036409 [Homalodisca vitripennis]|nr:hypothetical protein J6590_036409 [Homalodisca vitripennis]